MPTAASCTRTGRRIPSSGRATPGRLLNAAIVCQRTGPRRYCVEPVLAEELLARKSLARWVLGRLSETVLLVRPDEADAVIEELRRIGHTPRVVR